MVCLHDEENESDLSFHIPQKARKKGTFRRDLEVNHQRNEKVWVRRVPLNLFSPVIWHCEVFQDTNRGGIYQKWYFEILLWGLKRRSSFLSYSRVVSNHDINAQGRKISKKRWTRNQLRREIKGENERVEDLTAAVEAIWNYRAVWIIQTKKYEKDLWHLSCVPIGNLLRAANHP